MPIYEYECSKCGHTFEREQSMSEPPIKTCPKCKARKVTKLISRTSFVLKGGGLYADGYADAKKKAAADSTTSTSSDSPSASDSTSTASETKVSTDTKTADGGKKVESKPAKTGGKPAKSGKASGKSAA